MSMMSNAGAEAAASEILVFIRKKIAELNGMPDVVTALREVEKMAEEIRVVAKKGWY